MNNKFNTFLNSIISKASEKKYLLAVSGGMDSMAMLYLFQKSNLDFAVANVNFNLRAEESDGDSLFVKGYCEVNKIKLHYYNVDTHKYSKENGISTQMAARDLRYKWFDKLCLENNYDKVGIAHHLDDQVETLFINLLRGTGIAGMHGISTNKDFLLRPLLFTDRNGIEAFIKENKIPYREDSSNASNKYQRNYIRHNILTEFKKLRSDFSLSINNSISKIKEVEDYAQYYLEKEINEIVSTKDGKNSINIEKLLSSNSPKLVLFTYLQNFSFNESHIIDILACIADNKTGAIIQSSENEAHIDRKFIFISSKDNIRKSTKLEIDSLFDTKWVDNNIIIENDFKGNYKINNSSLGFIDFDKLQFPLTIRNWKQGDYFYPLGMKTKKKLSDFFIDNKIPNIEKENIKLLCNGEQIIWIIGHRIDNRYSITNKTKNILKLKYNGNY